jgi:hypothetical protein
VGKVGKWDDEKGEVDVRDNGMRELYIFITGK